MKTAMSVYIEGDVVEELHERGLNLSHTTEFALRKELGMSIPEELNKQVMSEFGMSIPDKVEKNRLGVQK